jgi:hypothetical protein
MASGIGLVLPLACQFPIYFNLRDFSIATWLQGAIL